MIATLALSALAGPPRAEVLAGWSGNGDQYYGYATVQPALLRSDEGSLIARATVSQLHSSSGDGEEVTRVDAPGLMVGPAFVLTPGDVALGLGLGVGGRRAGTWVGEEWQGSRVTVDAMVTGDLFWRPGQRASLYTQLSLGAVGGTLWMRGGGTYPVTPRDGAVSLWLGLEGTSSGPLPDLLHEVGPVAEVPIRPLGGTLAVRASAPVVDLVDGGFGRTTVGVAGYWAY